MKAGQAEIATKYGKHVGRGAPADEIAIPSQVQYADRGMLKNDNRHAGYIVQQKSDEYKALMNDPELEAGLIRATNEHNESTGATEQKIVHQTHQQKKAYA
ncbi:hypothetical protein BDB00DRAFT_783758 [Zychaea mexicana]|uniref:uncharacterized protein n=1 Tax=Zychaea mexicana TaxID=64656 RepID=UPI0022FE6042|nr:uncharacterized protein BDB00DRAFT_783758 [Zychaea mexicana]KAI9498627.1 hypothetical protein BDB00DRAFT_783758 [Zychaea mexicana]